jgi:membrane protein DedA with SNARE-associated domain
VTHLIDTLVIPFLQNLYGAVGYAGVFVAMTIESAMVPLPSELILPFAGFLVSDPTQVEPLTGRAWDFWTAVVVGTAGNTTGSVLSYTIGRYGGRPLLDRYGRYLLIRTHDLELAERWFARWGAPTAFFSRLLPIVRTFISFPAGVARMPFRTFVLFSTAGALPWSIVLVWAGAQLGAHWAAIRDALAPFDLLILVVIAAAIALYVWWHLGRPGMGREGNAP